MINIKNTIVILELDNGAYHQVLLTQDQQDYVLSLIEQLHDYKIKLAETPLEGIKCATIDAQSLN